MNNWNIKIKNNNGKFHSYLVCSDSTNISEVLKDAKRQLALSSDELDNIVEVVLLQDSDNKNFSKRIKNLKNFMAIQGSTPLSAVLGRNCEVQLINNGTTIHFTGDIDLVNPPRNQQRLVRNIADRINSSLTGNGTAAI